ncbi:MAG: pyridoxal phosphate-dependent aminotransferase [Spirochaetales bacterium]|nr:pyridoxal phosphate-dependent aminotransferase [Spirochaetales bacterium]
MRTEAQPAATPARARRLAGLGLSPIRAMYEGAPPGCVSLGLGEPGWSLPEPGRKALARAEGACPYGPNAGLPGLRAAIADYHGARVGEVMTGAGSQGVLFALFQAWAGPGDAVLVPDPGFLAYPALARVAGARPVSYALAADGSLDAAAFGAALDAAPDAKLAVLNHPANPTGAGATATALAAAARACEARGVILVSDEVYRELHLGARPPSLRDATTTGIVLGSASKAFAAPGLRVGWAVGAPELLEPARLIHNYMVTCAARPSQEAARALLEAAPSVLPAAREELSTRWEVFAEALREGLGVEAAPPSGGFYQWLRLPGRALADPLGFCIRLRDEAKVIVAPGLAFGERGRGFVRLSYAGDPDEIREGVRRLAPFWRTA